MQIRHSTAPLFKLAWEATDIDLILFLGTSTSVTNTYRSELDLARSH